MQPLNAFTQKHQIKYVLTDIDDTLTTSQKIFPEAFSGLWQLHNAGIQVIPVTGRPAGWCDMIARFWPVAGVVGENGAFFFRSLSHKLIRWYATEANQMAANKIKLEKIWQKIKEQVPRAQLAADQFCRIYDLAIDYSEDVIPALSKTEIATIVAIFLDHQANVKVSSIHINGWYGAYDKLSTCLKLLEAQFNLNREQAQSHCFFIGDSPNDEPMFRFFPFACGVANVKNFADEMLTLPTYITTAQGGLGFKEVADWLCHH